MDELFETTQDIVKRMVACITKITQQKSEKNWFNKFLDFWKEWFQQMFYDEIKKERLFSDLYKNITKCEINY